MTIMMMIIITMSDRRFQLTIAVYGKLSS